LSSRNADALRLVILRLASGSRERAAAGAPAAPAVAGGVIGQRIAEFAAPELDPSIAPPTSVVAMHPGRLVGSTVLSTAAVWFVLLVAAIVATASLAHAFFFIFTIVPVVLGLGSFLVNRVVKSLRYSIAATPDGVRVGFGLLSLSNETLPPGRIHAVSINQPLLWRPADWWEVRINLAGHSNARGADGRRNTTILPVGSRAEVFKVLELVLPGLIDERTRVLVEAGLQRGRPGDGYTTSPRRAAVIRWFSWRRNGFALEPEAVLLRRGAIWRELIVVPMARMQSVAVHQGPLLRALRLASAHVHTVAGPIRASVGALDTAVVDGMFRDVAAAGIAAAQADRTHRWRADAPVLAPPRPTDRRADA
ncbi:MAG TPA: PH domain-containing protein, partial [Pseudolysinimonas sp.]|nr:PH domain-containing protein [Pseudolysinimonas sp.]